MKKILLFTGMLLGTLQTGHAQEVTKVATLHSGGKVTVQSLPDKKTQIAANESKTAPASEQHAFVSHEAVLLKDGTQEIHLKDASGKITVISAAKGESIQAKYIDYLVKNHLPCACGGSSEKEQPAQTATRPATDRPNSNK